MAMRENCGSSGDTWEGSTGLTLLSSMPPTPTPLPSVLFGDHQGRGDAGSAHSLLMDRAVVAAGAADSGLEEMLMGMTLGNGASHTSYVSVGTSNSQSTPQMATGVIGAQSNQSTGRETAAAQTGPSGRPLLKAPMAPRPLDSAPANPTASSEAADTKGVKIGLRVSNGMKGGRTASVPTGMTIMSRGNSKHKLPATSEEVLKAVASAVVDERHNAFIKSLQKDLTTFIFDRTQHVHTIAVSELCTFRRSLLRQVADACQLEHSIVQTAVGRAIQWTKPDGAVPAVACKWVTELERVVSSAVLVRRTAVPTAPAVGRGQVRIMKRQDSDKHRAGKAAAEVQASGGQRVSETPPKSLQEREEEYRIARAKIFEGDNTSDSIPTYPEPPARSGRLRPPVVPTAGLYGDLRFPGGGSSGALGWPARPPFGYPGPRHAGMQWHGESIPGVPSGGWPTPVPQPSAYESQSWPVSGAGGCCTGGVRGGGDWSVGAFSPLSVSDGPSGWSVAYQRGVLPMGQSRPRSDGRFPSELIGAPDAPTHWQPHDVAATSRYGWAPKPVGTEPHSQYDSPGPNAIGGGRGTGAVGLTDDV